MLTDSQIKKLKNPPASQTTPDKYSGGGGLQLHLFGNGGKYWRIAYRFERKQKTFSVGIYPDVSSADARRKRDEAKKLLTQGIDPNEAKKQKIEKASGKDSFE